MKEKRKELSAMARRILMFEMFSTCEMIDNAVINQYFPYIDTDKRQFEFTDSSIRKKIQRDIEFLVAAGVVSYKLVNDEDGKYYHSGEGRLRVADSEELKRRHISETQMKKFITLSKFAKLLMTGIEIDISGDESDEEAELDSCLLDYKYNLENAFYDRPLTDYEVYRYNDPYVAEYVKISGITDFKELKEDFRIFETIGYLEYSREKGRFVSNFDCGCPERQDFGVRRGEDGKFYIEEVDFWA